jgi:hypothetical protein
MNLVGRKTGNEAPGHHLLKNTGASEYLRYEHGIIKVVGSKSVFIVPETPLDFIHLFPAVGFDVLAAPQQLMSHGVQTPIGKLVKRPAQSRRTVDNQTTLQIGNGKRSGAFGETQRHMPPADSQRQTKFHALLVQKG